jgi:hypothetical protein
LFALNLERAKEWKGMNAGTSDTNRPGSKLEEQDEISLRIQHILNSPIIWTSDKKFPEDMFELVIDDDTPQTIIIGPKHRDQFPELVEGGVTDEERESVRRVQLRIDKEIKRIFQMDDDRLLALVSALLVEEAIDTLLRELMPGYGKLLENIGFTFSLKIDVLRALHLVPFRLIANADLIRKLRNEFAHYLEVDSFSSLDSGRLEELKRRCTALAPELSILETHSQRFMVLAAVTTSSFYMMRPDVRELNGLLREDRVFLSQAYDELRQNMRQAARHEN